MDAAIHQAILRRIALASLFASEEGGDLIASIPSGTPATPEAIDAARERLARAGVVVAAEDGGAFLVDADATARAIEACREDASALNSTAGQGKRGRGRPRIHPAKAKLTPAQLRAVRREAGRKGGIEAAKRSGSAGHQKTTLYLEMGVANRVRSASDARGETLSRTVEAALDALRDATGQDF